MRKGINISHVIIENMGGRDQSQMKNKSLKKFEKIKSVPKDVPKSHNDDIDVLGGVITSKAARKLTRTLVCPVPNVFAESETTQVHGGRAE